MPNRSSRAQDPNLLAARILKLATEHPDKNPLAVELGRLGGLKGGRVRAEKLSAKKRSTIARNAAKARWASKRRG